MKKPRLLLSLALMAAAITTAGAARGADWPMWRADAARSASTDEPMPATLDLVWSRKLPPQDTAWKDEGEMKFDRSYMPVALGGRLFVGSTVNDTLTAYDLATGRELWRFYAEGPVRLAPAAWKDRVFFASDDGYLYALKAEDGSLLWKVRGGPTDRRLVGNERVVSTWPARGGPVVADGTVYFAAGVWPFMGTFIRAVDAASGRVLWTNDSTSFSWRLLPHAGSAGFSGLSAQGHLATSGNRLLVPGSRMNPAILDRTTGEFIAYGDVTGPYVGADGRYGFAGSDVFSLESGLDCRLEGLGRRIGLPVFTGDTWYTAEGVYDASSIKTAEAKAFRPDFGLEVPVLAGSIRKTVDTKGSVLLRAGGALLVRGRSTLDVIELPKAGAEPKVLTQLDVEEPSSALVADGRLVLVSVDGTIRCYGKASGEPTEWPEPEPAPLAGSKAWEAKAKAVLDAAGARAGYALVWGLADGGLVEELLRQSDLYVVAIDADAGRVSKLRERLSAAGLYGPRAAAFVAKPTDLDFAPYLASVVTSEDPRAAGIAEGPRFVERLFHVLRPYGGTACLEVPAAARTQMEASAAELKLEGLAVRSAGPLTLLVREGPLPGSADWEGQNADAGNTRCARDRLVKAPLGVLWFGNAMSNSLVLPRHGEGPVEQVAGGRLFIEGPNSISASDVYTGRLLWSRDFEGIGRYYDIAKHQRGAHVIGSNFYAVADAVYVAHGTSCHLLDPATGRTVRELKLPRAPGDDEDPGWMFLLVYEDLLIAGAHPIVPVENNRYNQPASSKRLVVMDRRSGKVLWERTAAETFRHYAVVAGRGKVFCIDRVSPEESLVLARRGLKPDDTPRILALDARTGALEWQSERCVSQDLSYSAEHDILLARGALRGEDGAVLWDQPEAADEIWWGKWGLMLRGDTIYTQGQQAIELASGIHRTALDPSGAEIPWRFSKRHGCGPSAGAWNLLTFRSGCAGYYDLAGDGGTGNLGGFRSGCTNNLIVADGVLSAPDYTRTCTCAYQNRSSLGLVHMPEAEHWTYSAAPRPGRAGYNFGAPGDRRDDAGTLWWDTPSAGSPSPELGFAVKPPAARTWYHHISSMSEGEAPAWIGASGLEGAREVTVAVPASVTAGGAKTLTVRLVFAEPEDSKPGERVFSVKVAGRAALDGLDVVKEAGGPRRTIVRGVRGVPVAEALTVTLAPAKGEPILSGVEILAEDAPAEVASP